jgi:predicted Zn-dependent protease
MPRWISVVIMSLGVLALPWAAQAGGLKLFKMSKSQELQVADELHKELESDPGLVDKGKQYDQVQRIGKQLVEKNKLDQYEYKFFVSKDEEVNAFATPGGYVYVTTGLLDVMGYDDAMVAGVMAHELGHAKDRHVAKGYEKAMQGSAGLTALGALLGKGSEDLVNAVGSLGGVVYLKYNRDQEEWADRYGVDLAYAAGYDAYGLTRSLECLGQLYGSDDHPIAEYMSNHPPTNDRIVRTKKIAYATTGGHYNGYRTIPCPPSQDHPMWALYGGRCGKNTKEDDGSAAGTEIGDATSLRRAGKRTQAK